MPRPRKGLRHPRGRRCRKCGGYLRATNKTRKCAPCGGDRVKVKDVRQHEEDFLRELMEGA